MPPNSYFGWSAYHPLPAYPTRDRRNIDDGLHPLLSRPRPLGLAGGHYAAPASSIVLRGRGVETPVRPWAPDPLAASVHHVGVDRRRLHAPVPEQLLDAPDVAPALSGGAWRTDAGRSGTRFVSPGRRTASFTALLGVRGAEGGSRRAGRTPDRLFPPLRPAPPGAAGAPDALGLAGGGRRPAGRGREGPGSWISTTSSV